MRSLYKTLLLAFLSLIFISCAKTPYTNRTQFIMLSPKEEIRMGYQAAREVLQKEPISHDRRLNYLVRKVGMRIAKVANQPNYKWEFYVIDKDIPNAFCLPGGKVFVYKGIFKIAKNEDQLATVIAHEVAHAILRHGAERMSMAQIGELGKELLSQTVLRGSQYAGLFDMAYGLGAQYGVLLPYSRKFEYEADEVGLYLMTKAGYDPREVLKFWENMMRISKGKNPPEFLSTHPADIHRIERLKALIPKALKYYR